METTQLIELLSLGEDSCHQFKENFHNIDSLAAEMVAFSNSAGGMICVGVQNDGTVGGLTTSDIDRLNQMVSNGASQNIRPAINPLTENINHPNGTVMVIHVPKGVNKPYMDKNGVIWVKTGADKRKATSREEIQRMFQQSGLLHADETPVNGMGMDQVDLPYFEKFLENNFHELINQESLPLPRLLANMNLAKDDVLNIAGSLLFAKTPQFRLPMFIVKAVAYPGTEIEDIRYTDSRDIGGKLSDVYQQTIGFLNANTHHRQENQGFNSIGKPEIPRIVWEELVVNALIHRDYFINAPIRIFVLMDRVEIISPGHLPNNLTIANIKCGNSNMRNPVLSSYSTRLLPYRGIGSGILRAIKEWPHIEFFDDRDGNLFRVVVGRTQTW